MPGGKLHRGWEPLKRLDNDPRFQRNPDIPPELQGDEIWLSERYQCTVRYLKSSDPSLPVGREGMMHLSIHANDRGPMRNWRHLQQIKNEVAGEDRTAVEVFPPEHELTDSANEYHLFVLPAGVNLGYGLGYDPLVSPDDDHVAKFNADSAHKGRQEPWEPGLTTGRTDASSPSRQRLAGMDIPSQIRGRT